MPLFSYEVVDRQGTVSTGQLEAENEGIVVSRLQGMGYLVTRVTKTKGSRFSLRSLEGNKKPL